MKKDTYGFTDNNVSVKPCMLFFLYTLPHILCVGARGRVSFSDMFGPDYYIITSLTNSGTARYLQAVGIPVDWYIIYHSVDMNGAISLVNSLKGYFCIT